MGQKHRMTPAPVRAISDQFASKKETVARALMSLGREIELIQKHRAGRDLAVAAASILARHEFVTRLAELERQFEIKLPRAHRRLWMQRPRSSFRNTAWRSAEGGENAFPHCVESAGFARTAEGGMETGRFCRDG